METDLTLSFNNVSKQDPQQVSSSAPPPILICAGRLPQRPVQTCENRVIFEIRSPAEVQSLCIVAENSLPPGYGLTVFKNVPGNAQEFDLIVGSIITREKPSIIIRNPFRTYLRMPTPALIGLSLEPVHLCKSVLPDPAEASKGLSGRAPTVESNQKRALDVAQNLINFAQSYEKTIPGEPDWIALPKNTLDKWFKKFGQQIKQDTKFMAHIGSGPS